MLAGKGVINSLISTLQTTIMTKKASYAHEYNSSTNLNRAINAFSLGLRLSPQEEPHGWHCKLWQESMVDEVTATRVELITIILTNEHSIKLPLSSYLSTHILACFSGVDRDVSLCSGCWWTQKLTIGLNVANKCQWMLTLKWFIYVANSSKAWGSPWKGGRKILRTRYQGWSDGNSVFCKWQYHSTNEVIEAIVDFSTSVQDKAS